MPLNENEKEKVRPEPRRRSLLRKAAAGAFGLVALKSAAAEARTEDGGQAAPPPPAPRGRQPGVRDSVKITKLETFLVKPRWLFLKVHTDAGVVGLGEPVTEGRALTCATAVKEIEPY
ncbi:MAG TPA: hypothetical protein VI589_02415, partial [Vicinamibacteria bacterium]